MFYFITANFNRDSSLNSAKKTLGHWSAMVERSLLGKHWYKKEAHERISFFAFAEHLDSNLHWHLMLRLPDENMKNHFRMIAANYWKQIVKSGSMDIQPILSEQDRIKASSYVTKDLLKTENYLAFTMSTEFSFK